MSMLDIHAEAINNVDEVYHNFLLRYKALYKIVYGVVEGKDDPSFYRSIIERFIPDDWQIDIVISGGKRKSCSAFKTFDWSRFDPRRIAFFLDRDTDEFVTSNRLEADNIYYTEGYSIENTFVNGDVFIRLLSEAYSVIDATPEEQAALLSDFNRDLKFFSVAMAPIMAQIVCWRVAGITAYLNDPNLGELFTFDNGVLSARSGFQTPKAIVHKFASMMGVEPSSEGERLKVEQVMTGSPNPEIYVRGKYLLWFFASIINYTHSNIISYVAAYDRPPRARYQIGPKTVGFAAAPRVRIPSSLRDFIEKTYLGFIGAHPILIH